MIILNNITIKPLDTIRYTENHNGKSHWAFVLSCDDGAKDKMISVTDLATKIHSILYASRITVHKVYDNRADALFDQTQHNEGL